MICLECKTEFKRNEVENSQGYCSIECRDRHNARVIRNAKLFSVKNIDSIDCEPEKDKNRMALIVTLNDVTEKEYEKFMATDHYIIEVNSLSKKVTFRLH